MIVCSEIRSQERERVVVDRVGILVEELLEEGGAGIIVWLCVRLAGGGKFCWADGARGLGR